MDDAAPPRVLAKGHDRTYYRSLPRRDLLLLARDEGICPEMAISMADRLASYERGMNPPFPGQFSFNYRSLES